MPFQPIVSHRLYQQVADQIGELIRRGEFAPGHRLPAERDLAKALGASRPVVREAMVALEIAGLVEVRSGSGAYVRPPGDAAPPRRRPKDAGPSPFDILAARCLVEGEIAFTAATEATEADLASITEALETMRAQMAAEQPSRESDRLFHLRIAAATHNTVLLPIAETLWNSQFGPVFTALSTRTHLPENRAATLREHTRIADALARRDPHAARAAMRAHLGEVMRILLSDDEVETAAD